MEWVSSRISGFTQQLFILFLKISRMEDGATEEVDLHGLCSNGEYTQEMQAGMGMLRGAMEKQSRVFLQSTFWHLSK